MCGFAGMLDFKHERSADELEAQVRAMAATLGHRGPDDNGVWLDAPAGIAFGHRRLAIFDLSQAGHQPMISASGRYVINYNGEIYNHRELRDELTSSGWSKPFAGHSDTEVLLSAIEAWGVHATLPRLNGMFAFALWDGAQRELYLARDRFGEKPLYYGFIGDTVVFGSELKALQALREANFEIDRNALALFFRYNCVPAPHTIYKRVFKLPPASSIVFSDAKYDPQPQRYWSLKHVAVSGTANQFAGSERSAVEQLESLLTKSVKQRMLADVPVGIFLSGGIDSSLITALAQRCSSTPVQTFSVGVRETAYNEAQDAEKVARHLGAQHTELYVAPSAALEVVPQLAGIYDEPFADSSQIPALLLSRLARKNVTVSLSGDGGDEVFGGYNRYVWVRRIWKRVGWMGKPMRARIGRSLKALSPRRWERLFTAMQRLPINGLKQRMAGDKLHKMAGVMDAASEQEMYLRLASHWLEPERLVLGSQGPTTPTTRNDAEFPDFVSAMMYADTMTFLPDDILTKVDRASMAVSLEVRAPYLDPDVVEFAWSLPQEMKIQYGKGKWLLRKLLHKFVPAEILERPKMGFGIPLDSWLRNELRDWAEDLLSEERLRRDGFLAPTLVREKWLQHIEGNHNWQYHLWDVLMLQSWLTHTQASAEAACAAEAR